MESTLIWCKNFSDKPGTAVVVKIEFKVQQKEHKAEIMQAA
jgi:hypothetical protein